jgi:hypothetical protein
MARTARALPSTRDGRRIFGFRTGETTRCTDCADDGDWLVVEPERHERCADCGRSLRTGRLPDDETEARDGPPTWIWALVAVVAVFALLGGNTVRGGGEALTTITQPGAGSSGDARYDAVYSQLEGICRELPMPELRRTFGPPDESAAALPATAGRWVVSKLGGGGSSDARTFDAAQLGCAKGLAARSG